MRRKTLLRALGRGALQGLILVVRILPLPVALWVGRVLGTMMRLLSRKRYGVAIKNLRIAFGDEISDEERHRIARESFKHAGMFAVEGIKFAYMPQAEVERRIKAVGYEQFEPVMARGKGCLFISAHLGNLEVMGRWLSARGYEILALARAARDQGTTDMMLRMRERMGIRVITLNQSLKPILVGLKRNACVTIVCDQNAADVFVPFFGQPTGTVDGPARIALRMGTPMVFPYCIRDGRGGYVVRSAGVYEAESTGNEKADVERVMTEVNRVLESLIRAHPEQWLWFHDRWRSSPGVVDPSLHTSSEQTSAAAIR